MLVEPKSLPFRTNIFPHSIANSFLNEKFAQRVCDYSSILNFESWMSFYPSLKIQKRVY